MKCEKCNHEYDYAAQQEAGMGYVKCPGCGVVTDQTGKTYEKVPEAPKVEESFFSSLVRTRRPYQDNTGK